MRLAANIIAQMAGEKETSGVARLPRRADHGATHAVGQVAPFPAP